MNVLVKKKVNSLHSSIPCIKLKEMFQPKLILEWNVLGFID